LQLHFAIFRQSLKQYRTKYQKQNFAIVSGLPGRYR
jgi:hypothetical protein